jgi:hypothetical protein
MVHRPNNLKSGICQYLISGDISAHTVLVHESKWSDGRLTLKAQDNVLVPHVQRGVNLGALDPIFL